MIGLGAVATWIGLSLATGSVATQDAFQRDLAALAKSAHRLAGYEDGSRAASKYVEEQLRAAGIQEVFVQEFPLVMPRTTECVLEADGQKHAILAVRANLVQASITPAEGLEGDTLYVGKGELGDYGKDLAKDRIVVLDFDCGKNWRHAFAFGAKAVLFVDTGNTEALPYHHVNVPANLPRFYVPRDVADALALTKASRKVRLLAACSWERKRGRNVIGVIRGTDPVFDKDKPDLREAVVLAAPLDSFSEVPLLSPGARDAASCAALLEIARALHADPPRRDVIVAFFDGQAQNHVGARYFYSALYRRIKTRKIVRPLDDRLEMIHDESEHVEQEQAVLSQAKLFASETAGMPKYNAALRRLRGCIRRVSDEAMQELGPLRIRYRKLRFPEEKRPPTPEEIAEMEALWPKTGRLGEIDRLEMVDLAWNAVLRRISQYRGVDDPEAVKAMAAKLISDPDRDRERLKRELFIERVNASFRESLELARHSCAFRLKELAVKRADTEKAIELRDAVGQKKNTIVLHISVNLGDKLGQWSLVHGDDSATLYGEDVEGLYSGLWKAARRVREDVAGRLPHMHPGPVSDLYQSRVFVPTRFVDSSVIARDFVRYNIAVMSVLDPLARQGLPSDTLANLDAETLFGQVPEIALFLRSFLGHRALTLDFPHRARVYVGEARWTGSRNFGPVIKQTDVGDPMRAPSVPNAVIAAVPFAEKTKLLHRAAIDETPPGFLWEIRVMSESDGIYELPPITRSRVWPVVAVTFDKPRGDPDAKSRGLISAITVQDYLRTNWQETQYAINIARMRGLTVVGLGFERLIPSTPMRALSTAEFRADRHLLFEIGNILVLFGPKDARAAKVFNPYGLVLLNNKKTREEYQGVGVSLEQPFDHLVGARQTACDLNCLNGYRLDLLRENQIGEESLEVLHGRSGDLLQDAETVPLESGDHYHGMLEGSAAYSRRMYKPLVGVMNDLVTAVVFLLLLAIPFAFAIERLLIGTPHIYRRIGWFALFFLITFVILFLVNPAFKLATTPIIIFLAFTIVLLSTLVMFIMLRKLETEMKKLQGLGVAAHTADVSRISTMVAAVNMGISTMRRRPLRTLLTASTVVLLTFTILTFASFSSVWGNRRTYVGPMVNAPTRILIRHPVWNPISEDIFLTLRGFLTGRASVVPRFWLAPIKEDVGEAAKNKANIRWLIATPGAKQVAPFSAAIGLDAEDVRAQEDLRNCFAKNARLDLLGTNGVFLTSAICDVLGLTDADVGKKSLTVGGTDLVYAGRIEDRFALQPMLEGSSILPVDYQTSMAGKDLASLSSSAVSDAEQSDSASFVSFNLDTVVIAPRDVIRRMGGRVRAICIYPEDEEEVDMIGHDVATISGYPTYVGKKGGVYRLFFSKLIAASGFRDLVIPVVLGGLIIFATMLGSVADREREIYTFSSLGLAPAHVSMLFFAEASIYAVVGGMGGYLLGQATAKILSTLSSMGVFAAPSMNFSSMNAVVTIFIVMGIVMLSTIYPAVKAARSANPGIQRSWKLPRPVGDIYDISFPFTVSEYDLTGVVSYLQEHFQSYSDASIGVFATVESHILRQEENDMLGFRAKVALAPFDLGIEQTFVMLSQPSDVEGIDEVRVLLRRTSGSYGDWQRANRVFIDDIRRQFLIWRTVDEAVAKKYRETTLGNWDRFPVESRAGILSDHEVQD